MDRSFPITFCLEIIFLLTVFLYLNTTTIFAHCAMCKTTTEQAINTSAVNSLGLAVLFLFVPAVIFFALMLLVIYKYK